MLDTTSDDRSAAMDAATVASLLAEHRAGRDPWVDYRFACLCLIATGRPLSPQAVRDLVMDVRTLGGRSVIRLSDAMRAADDYIARRVARPNLKAKAAAKARAAKQARTEAAA